MNNDLAIGFRAVGEAIESGKTIDRIFIRKGLTGDLYKDCFRLIRERNLPYQFVPEEKLNRITRKNHQGIIAVLSPIEYQSIEQIIPMIYEQGRDPFVIVADSVTDVRNFGAMVRTADCAGVDAVIIPAHSSAGINMDAIKTSAGAMLHVPICKVFNLPGTMVFLKECGLKLVAATEKAEKLCFDTDLKGPVALVMGSEETGISEAVLSKCDVGVRIPICGKVESLNVSAATAVLAYEILRQRLA